jgi:hypothetical protein
LPVRTGRPSEDNHGQVKGRVALWSLLALPWALLAAPGVSPRQEASGPVEFERDVMPILRHKCLPCHQGEFLGGGLDLSTPSTIAKGGIGGPVVVRGDSARSPLVQRILGQGGLPLMPLSGVPLEPEKVKVVRDWIDQGAKFGVPELDSATTGEKPTLGFNAKVWVVFKAHCLSCHSKDVPLGGLDLTDAASLSKGGASGAMVVPGDPDASVLLRRILGKDGKPQMPMGFAPLGDEKVALIRGWIAAGAKADTGDSRHWAYVPPVRPALPEVKDKLWGRNPIDAFVLARLDFEGLRPSPEADPRTLTRRLSLDLAGLPPSPEEAERAGDHAATVERLLSSPHYGERMAVPWLDIARYADSDGFEKDLRRTAWLYRDWVVAAFNENMPYDQFVAKQLAGDLLPDATVEDLIATGFHRNTMQNLEGGVDQAEAHYMKVVDRVGTTGTAFLGSTMACAQCHDHKYDPLSQKDFYAMAAVFSNTEVVPKGDASVSEEKWFEPEIPVPSPEQAARREALTSDEAKAEAAFRRDGQEFEAGFQAWLQAVKEAIPETAIGRPSVTAESGATVTPQPDGSFLASGPNPKSEVYRVNGTASGQISGIKVTAVPDPSLAGGGSGRAESGNFILTGLRVTVGGKPVPLLRARADYTQTGYDADGVVRSDAKRGWAVSGRTTQPTSLVAEFAVTVKGGRIEVVIEHGSLDWPNHALGRFRVSTLNVPNPAERVIDPETQRLLAVPERSEAAIQALRERYREIATARHAERRALEQVRAALAALQAEIPTAMVMREKPGEGPLQTNLRERGEFLSHGPLVDAAPPAEIGPKPPPKRFDRLALAEWITDHQNPLAARVAVNRIWQTVFGRGLVDTPDDFGTQGSPPTHPELLDWLAVEFIESGWDTKHMVRLMVTSATYRQSSRATPELLARDPENRLLARASRARLDAETVRDTTLAAAGLLSLKIGGPSVFPDQPDGVWDSPASGERYTPSAGPDRYRRGLYTFWKRTAPYPSFMAFDATSREVCTAKRVRTNTPLQALALLNDKVAMDAARALGRRARAEAGPDDEARIARAFLICTGREPSDAEADRLARLLASTRERYAREPENAAKLAGTAEDAAWTMVCNVLLNLDETITRE